jgi:arsenite-transporting ATPase
MEGLYKNMIGMKEVLTDQSVSSIRIVLNPEKMVIKESQRAFTLLSLFGYSVDGVIINRVIPDEVHDHFYDEWKKIQTHYINEVDACFKPLPIFKAHLENKEVIGKRLLSRVAKEIYGNEDPTKFFYREKPVNIVKTDGGYSLFLNLPFASKEDLDLWVKGEELIIRYKNYKRNILLPRALAFLEMEEAKLEGNVLKIKFGGDRNE